MEKLSCIHNVVIATCARHIGRKGEEEKQLLEKRVYSNGKLGPICNFFYPQFFKINGESKNKFYLLHTYSLFRTFRRHILTCTA